MLDVQDLVIDLNSFSIDPFHRSIATVVFPINILGARYPITGA